MSNELFSLHGKVALVTGGSRGIGYMIAQGLLSAGARVYISSRKEAACEQACETLSSFGDIQAIPCDVSTEKECQALIDHITEREPALHILVNNAGAAWGAPLAEYPEAAWDKLLAVNLKAPFFLAQKAQSLLEAASTPDDPARIINIGSIGGLILPAFETYAYSSSKAAIHHLTRHLAAAMAPNILVNAIAPGPFPSKMMEKSLQENGEEIRARTRVQRVGKAEDMAGAAVFLSARASSFITGVVLPVDGGISTTAGAK